MEGGLHELLCGDAGAVVRGGLRLELHARKEGDDQRGEQDEKGEDDDEGDASARMPGLLVGDELHRVSFSDRGSIWLRGW